MKWSEEKVVSVRLWLAWTLFTWACGFAMGLVLVML